MPPDIARLARLQRLERVRAIARQTAAQEVARAEGTLAQLHALAARTEGLTADYRRRADPADGYQLRLQGSFVAGLEAITRATLADAGQAQAVADRCQAELNQAERRRAAVEDRMTAQQRQIDRRNAGPVLGGRRATGTTFE